MNTPAHLPDPSEGSNFPQAGAIHTSKFGKGKKIVLTGEVRRPPVFIWPEPEAPTTPDESTTPLVEQHPPTKT